MSAQVSVIEDTIAPHGVRILSLSLVYQRFILPEVNTHRALSKSSASSRAIPVAKMLRDVEQNPAMPIHWGLNQPGMQADEEADVETKRMGQYVWREAAQDAAQHAKRLSGMGFHKQIANRLIEPFVWARTIVTGTDWENLFALRTDKAAQPEFRHLAILMLNAIQDSTPRSTSSGVGMWHLPYVTKEERESFSIDDCAKMSVARCARVSYLTHEGAKPDIEKDFRLYNQLWESGHFSPFEHQAVPTPHADDRSGNFRGWIQHRQLLPRSQWSFDMTKRIST